MLSPFLELLKTEVGKMQITHPEREGEIARAHALILHGMVLPSVDDPDTGKVLSSDMQRTYSVNGSCDCTAGEHGRQCKHLHAWRLYQYIEKKLDAQSTPVLTEPAPAPLPEAPASVNCHITLEGRQVQLTLRDTDEARLLQRLTTVLARYPVPQAPSPQGPTHQGQPLSREQHNAAAMHKPVIGFCAVHNVQMPWNEGKEGRKGWYSHRVEDGSWCKGK